MTPKPTSSSNDKKAFKSCVRALSKIEPAEVNNVTSKDGPQPVSKEEFMRTMEEKGTSSVSILQASNNHRKLKSVQFAGGPKAKFIIISVFDATEKKEYDVCALACGDLFPARDALKKCATDECVVNGETIPMVADCLRPKFISKQFWSTLMRRIPAVCSVFGKFLAANVEQCWLLYAPYNGENPLNGAAAVDTAVPLCKYAEAWQRALSGKPLHYESVDIVHYFVGIEELNVLDEFYHTPDPHFGQRTSIIRR